MKCNISNVVCCNTMPVACWDNSATLHLLAGITVQHISTIYLTLHRLWLISLFLFIALIKHSVSINNDLFFIF